MSSADIIGGVVRGGRVLPALHDRQERDVCEFRFYRKGTAPDTELIDGVEVTRESSLNR